MEKKERTLIRAAIPSPIWVMCCVRPHCGQLSVNLSGWRPEIQPNYPEKRRRNGIGRKKSAL